MEILKKAKNKWVIISVCVLILAFVGTEAALSYLSDETPPVENTLVAGSVACEVQETFDGNVKSDVSVANIGNTSAYVRAALLVNWRSESDTVEILATRPRAGVDYDIVFGSTVWVEGSDGYWYYSEPVLPEKSTECFIERIAPIDEAPEGYSLSVEIIASAIQANPTSVVETEWGVSAAGTTITPN